MELLEMRNFLEYELILPHYCQLKCIIDLDFTSIDFMWSVIRVIKTLISQ